MRRLLLSVTLLGTLAAVGTSCGGSDNSKTTPSNSTGGGKAVGGGKTGGGSAVSGNSAGGSGNSGSSSGGTTANTGGKATGGTAANTGGTTANTGGTATGGTAANTGGTTTNTGGKATGGTAANTGGTATAGANSGGTAPNTGGTAANTGGTATAGANTGGKATGGTTANTGGSATGGAASACIGNPVSTLPVMGTACSTVGDSQCDPSGGRCVCERGIWYCNTECASNYPTQPTPNSACHRGAACTYGAAGCACVSLQWMCVGTSACPATSPLTGAACSSLNIACDYPDADPRLHFVCYCSGGADGGTPNWTCAQSAACPATQPPLGSTTGCTGLAVCTYGNTHCACTQGGDPWVCI
jgi:hypothetical protein